MTPSQFFDALIAGAKTSLLSAAIPPAIKFLTFVQNNPSNFVGISLQAIVLKDELLAALPGIEAAEMASISNSLIAGLQAELTSLAPKT